MVELGKYCKIVSGSTPSRNTPEFWDGDIHWFTPKDLSGLVSKYVYEAPEKITTEGFKGCSTNLIPSNSLLFSSRAPIGHLAINKLECCTNQGFKTLIPNESLDVEYLYYAIKRIVPQLQELGNGATFKELSKSTFEKVQIPLPPLPVQQKIAAILDAADAYRQKTKTLIDKYDQLAQSLFLDMFGDPVKNEKGWEKVKFEELVSKDCPLTYGIVQPGEETENGVPCVRPVDLTTQYVNVETLKRIDPKISSQFKRTILKGGEILLSVRGSVGVISIADLSLKGSNVTRGIVPIWFDEIISNKLFFFYLYKTDRIQNQINGLAKGATLIQINLSDLRNLELIKPPIALQNQFAERINVIEAQKQQAQASLQKAEELFNSLLQKAFKGELVS